MMEASEDLSEWEVECLARWGRILTGSKGHWCPEWDGMPIDSTCTEFDTCMCDVVLGEV